MGGDAADDAPPSITCDTCGTDCWAESYFVADEEQDLCPVCYLKISVVKSFTAEHQSEGGRPMAARRPGRASIVEEETKNDEKIKIKIKSYEHATPKYTRFISRRVEWGKSAVPFVSVTIIIYNHGSFLYKHNNTKQTHQHNKPKQNRLII